MEFRNDTFKILQLTDTHFGNLPHHADDMRTFDLIDKLITNESPDLIVHTGDIIWSDGVKDPDKVFRIVMEFIDKYDIPFAITFGNHDTEETVTRSDLRSIYDEVIRNKPEMADSFIVADKESYTIPLRDNGDDIAILYVIDSGADDKLGYGTYEWVLPEQVEWFRKTSEKYKKNDGVKRGIVFQHIPLPEYWDSKDELLYGVQLETNEAISAPKINTGLFANMALNGEIWGMLVGHDHDNNFDSLHHGVHLAFANSTGYQAYGDVRKGGTVIEISKDPFEIKTYNVQADEDN